MVLDPAIIDRVTRDVRLNVQAGMAQMFVERQQAAPFGLTPTRPTPVGLTPPSATPFPSTPSQTSPFGLGSTATPATPFGLGSLGAPNPAAPGAFAGLPSAGMDPTQRLPPPFTWRPPQVPVYTPPPHVETAQEILARLAPPPPPTWNIPPDLGFVPQTTPFVSQTMTLGLKGEPMSKRKAELEYAKTMAHRMGLVITSTTTGKHTPGSLHYQGLAIDVDGTSQQLERYYRYFAKRRPEELFYDPMGGIDHGKPIGAIGGHSDHLHIAF